VTIIPGTYTPPTGVRFLNASRAALGSLDFGVVEAAGVAWVLEDVQGWGSPASTIQVVQKPRSFGGWAGPAYLPARSVTLAGSVDAPTTAALSDAIDRLITAASLSATQLTVIEGGRVRSAMVRRQGEVQITWTSDLAATWTVQLVATDPRKYGPPVTATCGLPSSSGGLTWPVTFPATWTGVTNSGTVSIANQGTTSAPVFLTITGPVVGPIVTHLGSGTQLVFSSALTLGTGEFLTVDMDKRETLGNGQASRNGYVLSRGWFSADPGANQYAFQAQTYNSSAQLSVTVPSGAWQ
jgi:hypothetical protein